MCSTAAQELPSNAGVVSNTRSLSALGHPQAAIGIGDGHPVLCLSTTFFAPKSNRRTKVPFHRGYYRLRHRVENLFQRLKRFRAVGTRYDKSDVHFGGGLHLSAVIDWLRFGGLKTHPRHNGHPKAITQAAIDMSAAYAKGVRENFGNAQIVYDKFHVVQSVVEACDQIRKAESALNAESRERLERTRWLWRKNPENWTAKEAQSWEAMAKERGTTGLAYEMRLVMQDIYRCP